ncbi:MAG: hypothetical protein A2X22_01245 [Bacteroidetes bacterium GWF2_49_14]|nr:MAG: hypothetical protein A2X22_01245 [Bacteroidetes bacterium GWF2_49_14]HBB92983.1 hypothetical protein [Bacteroidales bacterium]
MKKTIILALLFTVYAGLSAQDRKSGFDMKFGTGFGFMGSGDMRTLSFENELNYKINRYFTAAASIGIGKSDRGVMDHADYLMGSANLFVSPFRNDKGNNFRIGGGASFFNHTNVYHNWDLQNGTVYEMYRRKTTGFNVILEDEQRIGSTLLIGLKLFLTGGVKQGGIIFGSMVKVGAVL